jgi:dTDP-4-dehydrorhamnose 3,5-epimerase-like enzyme
MFYDLKTINADDGTLVPIEFNGLPFEPKRVFYVCNVPKGEERGMHAHFITRQLLICVKGEILVKLHDGVNQSQYILKPHHAILINNMIWDSQVFQTGDDVLLSICSTAYDKSDYIEDFNSFVNIKKDK